MGEDTRQGNVGGLYGVGITLSIPTQKLYELVDQVRMRASMTGSLGEAKVFLAILVGINPTRREGRDLIRKQFGEVAGAIVDGVLRMAAISDVRLADS